MTKFLNKSFSVSMAGIKDENWERIFGKKSKPEKGSKEATDPTKEDRPPATEQTK